VKLRVFLVLAIVTIIGVVAINQIPKLVASQNSQIGIVIKVADGDSLTISTDNGKEKIRLCGIDAPEKAQPLGQESKRNLQRLALNKQVAITPVERDRYGRLVAEVSVLSVPEIDLNAEQLTSGLAYHYAQYSDKCPNRDVLITAEGIGKAKRLGVWSANYQKPWDYRQQRRG
jgi:micrococcal nuclease